MNKTVLLVTSEFLPGPGGIGRHAYELARQLKKNGFEINVITAYRPEYGRLEESDFRITYVRRILLFNSIYFAINVLLQVFRRPRFVIATGTKSLIVSLPGIITSETLAVLHGHELLMGSKYKQRLQAFVLRRYKKIVAVSDFAKANARSRLGTKEIVVIPNGVDTKNRAVTIRRGIPRGTLEILTVGTVSPRKGQHNVISHLSHAMVIYNDLHYTAVGQLRDPQLAYECVEKTKTKDRVEFAGVLSDAELEKTYDRASIFVMLSENQKNGDVEGFGISILEANLRGLPAIGAKGCGIEQAIKNGYNGILIDNKDPKQFTDALGLILKDYPAFSDRAVKWAENHDWEQIGIRYVNCLIKGTGN